MAGIRTPLPIQQMAEAMPETYRQYLQTARQLESHYHDMQELEFTIERGKLWMLQTRRGKRTGKAATRIAIDLVNEGVVSRKEALMRVSPEQLEQLLHPVVDPAARPRRSPPACRPRRGRRPAKSSSTPVKPKLSARRGRKSSSSATKPTPTTFMAWWRRRRL